VLANPHGGDIDSFSSLLHALPDWHLSGTPADWIKALHVEVRREIQSAGNGGQS
jgi:hypothetical protein